MVQAEYSLNNRKHGNETLFPNWQKKSWQTFEETSGYVRPRTGQQMAQLHNKYMMMMMTVYIAHALVDEFPVCF